MSKNPLSVLIDRLVPDSLEPVLRTLLGSDFPRRGEGNRFRVIACGSFRGTLTADLLTFARTQKLNAAMVLMQEDDTQRVLHFHRGVVVGADSNVLFERLGRILFKGGVIDKADADALVDCEEKLGLAHTLEMLPEEASTWGLDRRTWEIGTALAFMSGAQFLFVEGAAPLPGIPRVEIEPVQLAMEGLRRYDEWRGGSRPADTERTEQVPVAHAPDRTPLDRAAIEARVLDAEGTGRPVRQTAAPSPRDAADAIMKLLSEQE